MRRYIAQAVGQLSIARLPKRMRMSRTHRVQRRPAPPDDGVVRIMRERRRASTVSIVTGLKPLELENVAQLLKRHCATGGTAKNGTVEIQGDHREKIAAWFAAQGRTVRFAGG
jgi:translation initiation factor 1